MPEPADDGVPRPPPLPLPEPRNRTRIGRTASRIGVHPRTERAQRASAALVQHAYAAGSSDNICAMGLCFGDGNGGGAGSDGGTPTDAETRAATTLQAVQRGRVAREARRAFFVWDLPILPVCAVAQAKSWTFLVARWTFAHQ